MDNQLGSEYLRKILLQNMDYHQDLQLLPANGIDRFKLDQLNSWLVDLFVNQGVIFGFFLMPFLISYFL
jgi:hypothetical protein